MGQNLSLFTSLNDNILEHIVDFITVDSILNLRVAHDVFADWIDNQYAVDLTLPMRRKDAEQGQLFEKPILQITLKEDKVDDVNDEPISKAFINKLITYKLKGLHLECSIEKSKENQVIHTNLGQKIFFNLLHKHFNKPMKHLSKMSITLMPASSRIVSFKSISRCMPNVTELDISGCLSYQESCHWDEPLGLPNLEVFTYNYNYDLNVSQYTLESDHARNFHFLSLSLRRRRCPKIKEINQIIHPVIPKENSQNKIKRNMIFKKSSRKFLKVSKSIKNLKCSRRVKMVKKHRRCKNSYVFTKVFSGMTL